MLRSRRRGALVIRIVGTSVIWVSLLGCPSGISTEGAEIGEGGLEWGCRDVTDNDGNGLLDCEDSACAGHADCSNAALSDSERQGDAADDTGESPGGDAVAMGVEIRPEHPLPSDDLECVITTPAMGPSAVGIAHKLVWTRNGVQLGAEPVLPAAQTSDGETWSCEVTATNAEGEVVDEVNVLVEVKINHPPSQPDVALEQIGNSELVCYLARPALDPEEDTVRYRYAWKVDGADDPDHTCSVLSLSGSYASGRTFTCTVTPSDLYGDGEAGSASHVVETDE